jgi:hypothetical protein
VRGGEVGRDGGGGGAEEIEEEEERDLVQRRFVLIMGCRGRVECGVPLFRKCSIAKSSQSHILYQHKERLLGFGVAVP